MISIFHGNDETTHDAFQAWRVANEDGLTLAESPKGQARLHWSQDKRESADGRGCSHQGGSGAKFGEDKGACYTKARKVCATNASELRDWAASNDVAIKHCAHCDTRKFPFPA